MDRQLTLKASDFDVDYLHHSQLSLCFIAQGVEVKLTAVIDQAENLGRLAGETLKRDAGPDYFTHLGH